MTEWQGGGRRGDVEVEAEEGGLFSRSAFEPGNPVSREEDIRTPRVLPSPEEVLASLPFWLFSLSGSSLKNDKILKKTKFQTKEILLLLLKPQDKMAYF